MPYLRVEPDTYNLSSKQMYKFDTCQWCGSTDWNLRFYQNHSNKAESSRGHMAHVIARRSCAECGKTTALVKSNI